MATDDPIRASDSDREIVVDALREAYTEGRLTLEEFDERMATAYASKTWGDLRKLTDDLPSQPILGSDVPGRPVPAAPKPAFQPAQPPAPLQTRRHRPVGLLIPVAVWTLLALRGGAGDGFVFIVFAMVAFAVLMSAMRRR